MVMHISSKLLKSHFHPHPKFLTFYSDLNSCLWHCPNLAVFLTFSILFGTWFSSLISSQLTLLLGVLIVSRDSHCFTLSPSLLLPAIHFMAQFTGYPLRSSYDWEQPLHVEEPEHLQSWPHLFPVSSPFLTAKSIVDDFKNRSKYAAIYSILCMF